MAEFPGHITELGDKIASLKVSDAVLLGSYLEEVHHIKPAAGAVAVAGPAAAAGPAAILAFLDPPASPTSGWIAANIADIAEFTITDSALAPVGSYTPQIFTLGEDAIGCA